MDIVAAYYDKSDESAKVFILDLAGVTGSSKALAITRKALKSGNKVLYEKSVRTLSSWPNDSCAPDLLELARNAPEKTTRILSLRGYIKLTAKGGDGRKKLEKLKACQDLVKGVDEKRLFLGAVRDSKQLDAFAILTAYLDDEAVKAEAQQATVALADSLDKKYPEEVTDVLGLILNDPDVGKNILKKAQSIYDTTSTQKKKKKKR